MASTSSDADLVIADVTSLSVGQLKKLIADAGLTVPAGVLEKSELQACARDAQVALVAQRTGSGEVRWVTCQFCEKEFAAASEEECTAHMATCSAFAEQHADRAQDGEQQSDCAPGGNPFNDTS
mmetsp:Transcript_90263/g.229530  ORF Transcript_90263/g.229530 Transcript_90263/m.229530 type:complete len:124 (+) Transcript_90263:103-474(+)